MSVDSIKILFTGDFAPCGGYEKLTLVTGPKVFGDLQKDIADADLSFLNLETPLCIDGSPIKKIGPNLRAHPDCIMAVADAGFKAVGLANNHIMDFGENGLNETLHTCTRAGLIACGAGKSLSSSQEVAYFNQSGLRIAIIAVAENEFSIAEPNKAGAAPLDPIDNVIQIERAKETADLVFVTIHGGNEYFPFPRPGLRKLCRFYIAQGVDAVICHHIHIAGAYEFFLNKPIVYGLGNFIFDRDPAPKGWDEGYAVRLVYRLEDKGLSSFELVPYAQSVCQGGLLKQKGDKLGSFSEMIQSYRNILENDEAYLEEWDRYCLRQKNIMLIKQYFPFPFRGMRKLSSVFDFSKFLLPTAKSRSVKLNMIRCESHLELLRAVLKEEYTATRHNP